MKILMIDDDPELGELIVSVLGMYAIDVDLAYTPAQGLEKLQKDSYDLLLLDVMLPEINGLEFCRNIRQSSTSLKDLPIIIVSARKELVDMVVGLETGADDYVGKPFEPRELVARINAVMRRAGKKEQEKVNSSIYRFELGNDELVINTSALTVAINDHKLELTAMEYDVLSTLAKHYGEVLNNDELSKLCESVDPMYPESLVSLIYRLRNKIKAGGAENEFIRTVRSKGYSIAGTMVH